MQSDTDIPDGWKEFEERLNSGVDLVSALRFNNTDSSAETKPLNEMKVEISGEEFTLEFLAPSFDDIHKIENPNGELKIEPILPIPKIPLSSVLPLEPTKENFELEDVEDMDTSSLVL